MVGPGEVRWEVYTKVLVGSCLRKRVTVYGVGMVRNVLLACEGDYFAFFRV